MLFTFILLFITGSTISMNYENGKICRLCLSEGEVMCPIFSTSSKNGLQGVALPHRIMSCAQIRVITISNNYNILIKYIIVFVNFYFCNLRKSIFCSHAFTHKVYYMFYLLLQFFVTYYSLHKN